MSFASRKLRAALFIISVAWTVVSDVAIAASINSASGEDAGYYPGLASDKFGGGAEEWQAWFETRKQSLAEIRHLADDMKAGARPHRCLGTTLFECVASLSLTFAVADEMSPYGALSDPPPPDVNGKSLADPSVFLQAFIPKAARQPGHDSVQLDIRTDGNRIVRSITASMIEDPVTARTQEEYDRTGAFQFVTGIADQCKSDTPNDVARFIENDVKPKLRHVEEQPSDDIFDIHHRQAVVKHCGLKLTFDTLTARSIGSVSTTNPHGYFGGMTIKAELIKGNRLK